MDAFDLISLAAGLIFAPLVAWFYPHCARPGLVWARARRPAFVVALLSTAFGFLAGMLMAIDGLRLLPQPYIPVVIGLQLLWLPAVLSFYRPHWIVRLTGGPIGA